MKKNNGLLMLILCFSLNIGLFSQNSFYTENIFKILLFEDCRILKNGKLQVKDKVFIDALEKNYKFKIDTIKSEGFIDDYIFFSVNDDGILLKSSAKDITEPVLFKLSCVKYIFVVNKKSGQYYRLLGFDKNDFLQLYRDLRERKFDKTKNIKVFSKNHIVEGLDFKCLYKFSKSDDYDTKKFPCCQRCQDNVIIN